MAIPSAAGVGEVEDLIEVGIEIGFGYEVEFAVIVFCPNIAVVVFGHGAAVHADGGYGYDFAECFEVSAKLFVGFVNIAP